ncbi:MAG: ferritin family protein [Candidatus Omnitrophota bacterium]|nr:ferritin family protein [Candidatus Omnitrophota bacterium]
MDEILTGKEALELAIKAEEKGAALYKTLARNSKNFHVSRVFKHLADEENKHIDELKKWDASLTPYKPAEAYPGEYSLYIKAMAEESTFKCDMACEKSLEKNISEEDAIKAGINFEKDLIVFLHNIKKHIKKGDEKIVNSVMESEEGHLKKLYTLQKEIKG